MERWRDAGGQASSEYVALVALVAVVLALAAGLTSGGVGGAVLAGVQHGLCRVADVRCPAPQKPRDALDPCPVERATSGESLSGAFEAVELAGGATLTAVRLSDGRVTVTLTERQTVGGTIGLGWSIALGDRHGGEATAGVAARVASGRAWTLPHAAAARAFIARYGGKATVTGKAVDMVRSGCSILCDALGWRPHDELPPADERSLGGGFAARLGASLGVADMEASQGRLLGARLGRDGGSTWYVAHDATTGVALLPADALGASSDREVVISYSLDARQRPVALTIETVARDSATAALRAAGRRASASASGAIARVTELAATLDLRDRRNRAVAAAFAAARDGSLGFAELLRRASAVGRRVAEAGVIDRRTYAVSSSALALGAEVALGPRLGGGFERTREGMRLVSAETRLPGLPFLPRDDCRPA